MPGRWTDTGQVAGHFMMKRPCLPELAFSHRLASCGLGLHCVHTFPGHDIMTVHRHLIKPLPAILATLLAACAANPVYPPEWATSDASPQQVAQAPEQVGNAQVIWGGRILGVENQADHTEVEILAYPLDAEQRPRPDDVGAGRFLALLPGYVEALDYPVNGWVTLQGQIRGVRSGRVGQAPYVFPLLDVQAAHLWPREESRPRSNVHFNVGLGVGIR